MLEENRNLYRRRRIVDHYSQLQQLQPAEQVILERFRGQWAKLRMLDIGIGGGRTTAHFAPLVAEYVGIDYAAEMVTACQTRFTQSAKPETGKALSLTVADARALPYADKTFDFILFSFNGIDYVDHAGRLRILEEVRRVGKSGGYFCFSSHNLQGLAREFNFRAKLSLNPIKTYTNLVMLALLMGLNPGVSPAHLQTADYLIVRDESHNFQLQTYYIRPRAQLQQLAPCFSNTEIYSWSTGLPMSGDQLASNQELWVYYLSEIA